MVEPLHRTTSPISKNPQPSPPSVRVAPEVTSPEIQSVGAPPSLHADRIIGLMLQQMVKQHAALWSAIHAITKGPYVRDGNPRAQAKLHARIKKLGALGTDLIPGKRGRYELHIYSLAGWDPQRDDLIEPGDPIPEKPWICTLFHVVRGEGQGWVNYESSLCIFLTHHCLSRSAQRWAVRTVSDLSAVIKNIIRVALEYLYKRRMADMAAGRDVSAGAWFDTPPEGVRLPMPRDDWSRGDGSGGRDMIVVEKHETREAIVVSTVLD